MDEREFYEELCLDVLRVDKHVRFAGVIDDRGLLIVGKYREGINSLFIDSSPLQSPKTGSHINSSADEHDKNRRNVLHISSFQVSKTAFSLNKQFEPDLGELNYQLVSFNKVSLVTVAVTNRNDRYLCVSIDPVPDINNILAKILQAI